MKKISIIVAAAIVSASASAADFTDTAKVISSRPVYQTVTTQECHMVTAQPQAQQGDRSMGGSILGGVVGGLLGSQVGQGNGKTAAAAIGAIAGAIGGDRIQNSQQDQPQQQQVCNPVQSQQIVGYQVQYEYAGHQGRGVMQSQPGDAITVGIGIIQ